MSLEKKERVLPAGLEASSPLGEGYEVMVRFGGWRVAVITWALRFQREELWRLERHRETDEVFVLLAGKAVLFIGREGIPEELEPGLIYRVKQDVWHAVSVSRDAWVLICENEDTGPENTEYMEWRERV